jgi:hypothetical protein
LQEERGALRLSALRQGNRQSGATGTGVIYTRVRRNGARRSRQGARAFPCGAGCAVPRGLGAWARRPG